MPSVGADVVKLPPYEKILVFTAVMASATVATMFAIFVATGIGQDPLQYVHPVDEYLEILKRNPAVLKTAVGFDNLFIALYVAMFVSLGGALRRLGAPWLYSVAAISLICLSGLLDLVENMHFLTMIASVERGQGISATEISLQVIESLVKFHVSYIGLLLLSFALPTTTGAERSLVFLLRWVQLPVGLLIYVAPTAIAVPLVIVRFMFFFFALLLLAWTFRRRTLDSNARG